MVDLSKEMKAWREKWDVTQETSARLMKVALMTWGEWERGKTPKPANQRRLRRLFEKNPHELPGG